MKHICISALVLFFSICTKPALAQYQSSGAPTGESLGFGGEGGYATSAQFDGTKQYAPYRIAGGLFSRFELPVVYDQFNLTFSAGVNVFLSDQTIRHIFNRADSYTEQVYVFVPLKVGGKYYLTNSIYASLEGGVVANMSNSYKITPVYSPGIGVSVPFMQERALDIGLKYETWNQADVYGETFIKSFFTLGVTYKFSVGR